MTRIEFGNAYQNDGYKRTVRYLQRQGVAKAEAEELAQEAWVRSWERRWQLRDERYLFSWVNAIARSLLMTHFRRPQLVELSNETRELAVVPPVDLIEIDMRRGIQRCKPHHRCSLEDYLEGYSNLELAAQTGQSAAAVHALAYRARRALREKLLARDRQDQPARSVSRKKAQREENARLPKATSL
jgi:DNA-directed RNA polymerase specialized sigma24 family protein